jgi:hypothetical protein
LADEALEGLLVDAVREADRWLLVLEDGRRYPIHPATRYAVAAWLPDEEPEAGERLPQTHYRLEDLAGLLDERGPLEVEFDLLEDGSVTRLSFWEPGSRPF